LLFKLTSAERKAHSVMEIFESFK